MYKQYRNRITAILTIALIGLFSSSLCAQYISGPTTVTLGDYADYYFVNASSDEVSSASWNVDYGSIQTQSTGVYYVSALFDSQGTSYIDVTFFNGFYWTSVYLAVEVVGASVPTPTLSSVTQPTCATTTGSFTITNYNAAYTYTASPSSGVVISGATVTAPQGSYAITATSGGSNSPSASVTVNSPPSGSGCGLSDENYIHTITPQIGTTDISTLTEAQKLESTTYFDGLGRPMQSIGIRAGGNNEDVITHITYDSFGRQSKEYLPYTAISNGGLFRTDALNATNTFYDATKYDADFPGMSTSNINPYSEKQFEASPLNRVLKQAAPGDAWKLGNGHEIKLDYQTNIASDAVKNFDVSLTFADNTYIPTLTQSSVNSGFYNANELYKTITYDENTAVVPSESNGSTVEFKNKQGQVVLKRTYGTSIVNNVLQTNVSHDTYYVYDDYGNLSYVIPPKADGSITDTVLSELCYQYKYDYHNRLVEKKLPGKGIATDWEEIVYNKLDQPILTRDPNLKAQGKWLFTKYDAFGRVAYTGLINNSSTRTALQNAADGTSSQYVTKSSTATTIAGTTIYYNNGAYPNVAVTDEIHTINYYDDYSFDLNGASATGSYHVPITNAKGLATGSKVRVLGTTNWITNVNYYDAKGRSIYTYSKNDYLLTTSTVNIKLDFVGKVQETTSTHLKNSVTTTVVDVFTYDQAGRLTKQTQAINGAATPEVIAENSYDELGQLIQKKVGGKTTQSRLQTVDYAYNIRGWLKNINDVNTIGTDLFAFQINYNDIADVSKKLYNGNISQTFWKTANSDPSLKNYTYTYDALNRLTLAESQDSGRYNESLSYDKNGNIMGLLRLGNTILNTQNFGTIDNLGYVYDGGNKLMKVEDSSGNAEGFNNGTSGSNTDYTYDANGNMLTDANKGIITAITYNHLNLPIQVTFATGNIQYVYDATGVKQRKIVSTGITTDYAGGYIYENNNLKFFSQPEGYVSYNSGAFDYIYQYKDHLGNVRLSYDKNLAIVEENNYYPFGLKQKGYNNTPNYSYGSPQAEKYKYNGKELQDELGLNWYDYHARNYDPALGRWMNIDPKAEMSRRFSPYTYAMDNPVFFIDPDGMIVTPGSQKEWDSQKKNITSERDRLQGKVDKFTTTAASKGWSAEKLAGKIGNLNERIGSINGSLGNLGTLEQSSQSYSLNKIGAGQTGDTSYDPATGDVVISFGSTGNFVHETTHAGQFESGDIAFDSVSGKPYASDTGDEISAYKAQYAFDPASVSGLPSSTSVNSSSDITANWLQNVSDSSGNKIYAPGGSANTGISPLNTNSTRADILKAYPSNSALQSLPNNFTYKSISTLKSRK